MYEQLSELSPFIALLTAVTVLLMQSLFLIAFVRFRKRSIQHIKKLESTISVLSSGSLGMGQKMLSLEAKMSNLRDTQDEMKQSDIDFSYTQAQKLISQGVDNDAIAANSGLSATEINLMRLLHSKSAEYVEDHA